MTKEAKILLGIAVVVVIGGILLAVFANPQPEAPGATVDGQTLIREHSYMTKQASAKVNLVEFGDFQCPACKAAQPTIKRIIEEYKDNPDVNVVFRHFPLDSIHPNAHIASEAAEAAGAQGKFWEMYDLLYEKQDEWSASPAPLDIFVSYAGQLGLNVDEFKAAAGQRRFADLINQDYKDGTDAAVNSTPSIFINGEKMTGYQFEVLKEKIEAELAETPEPSPTPAVSPAPTPTPTPVPTAAQ